MDDESIWQQMEIQNEESFSLGLKNVSKFLAASTDKFKLNLGDIQQESEEEAEEGGDSEGNSENSNEEVGSEDGVDQEDEENDSEEDENGSQEGSEDGEDSLDNEEAARAFKNRGKKSIVDDQFFKLSEMEQFLQIEDRRAEKSDQDEDTGIDLFTSIDDTNREESMKYGDFFDQQNEEAGEEEEASESEDDDEPKSSHQLKEERLKKKIQHLENAMLDDRPWQMKGEVKGDSRPQNSLLEEILEFDTTTRPAPVITEEVTMKLEDIIKQRIKDKAFDDVERKVKPSDIQMEYKKQLVLDQEKSKQSLAQIYEKEFIDQMANAKGGEEEPEEPKEHKEIRADLKKLFEKLDLMSNFFYTPRPAQPELKIITNLPTISMEEVAPVAVSDAAMLAPEEVKRKSKGDVLGSGERTKTDKNRERRHKKVFQKQKFQKNPMAGKSLLEKVSKGRNVEKVS
jgi:U3 small nucleolar RNA-associated protein MPP10